jgi:predicted flavoprotein YhiN
MIKTDIAIIGGGAAGLFAAAKISGKKETLAIILFEKMPRCGRKIGLTGKGRCNLTNTREWPDFSTHIHPNANFFKSSFFACSNNDVMSFFEGIGLKLSIERGNRVYPASMRATDVVDALAGYIKREGIKIINNCTIKEIIPAVDSSYTAQTEEKKETIRPEKNISGYYRFKLLGQNGEIIAFAKSVIIATGGLSYQSTGSTGDGYIMAKQLGHTVTRQFPSLTALKPKGRWAQKASLKNVAVTLIIDGNEVANEFGDLDFTDGGIEGPIGYKVSRKAVEALEERRKVSLILDLKPSLSSEQLQNRILREYSQGNSSLPALLSRLLPKDIIQSFTEYLNQCHHIKECRDKGHTAQLIAATLKNWKFEIIGNVGYERAVVTAGGISLKEISQKTLESKLVKGLYFAGEVIDMDCDTGGYNLQMAFSTGALAAENAAKQTNEARDKEGKEQNGEREKAD